MRRAFIITAMSLLMAGCAAEKVPDDSRVGKFVITYQSIQAQEGTGPRAAMICGDDAYKAFNYPQSVKPIRGRTFYSEIWVCGRANAVEAGNPIAIKQHDTAKENKALEELKAIESLSYDQAKDYFLREKHAINTNCLVWGDVTMITGKYPAMVIAGSVDMGAKPKWDGKEFSFTFNGGSMIARFTPSEPKHKLLIQAGDKFYGCGPSSINHDYD